MRNFRLTLCYDGSRYSGWQKQGNTGNTIQEKIEALLTRLLGQPVEIAGCGRTDAGVHARRQVCSFRVETDMGCAELLARLRQYLPEDIGALALEEAPPRFHARLSCTEKSYLYRIWNSGAPNVFERKYLYRYPGALDTDAMRRAAQALIGEHDFKSFCANRRMKKSTVRRIDEIKIVEHGTKIELLYTGNGFLYNMVRILTGTLLEIGSGMRKPEEMKVILEAKNRDMAGRTAPPEGLFLLHVAYEGERKTV